MNTINATAAIRSEENTLFIEGILDFDSVVPLLPVLDDALKSRAGTANAPAVLDVDLSAVTYTNSAGVALLLDLLRKSVARYVVVTLRHIPADMQDIIHISGLQDVLANPAVPATV